MYPVIGEFALVLALATAIIQATVPLIGAVRNEPRTMRLASVAAQAQFLFLLTAILCLGYSMVHNDFSVKYVALNSNTALPLQYRIAAIWGGHEGSLLLWAFFLSIWGLAVTLFSRSISLVFRTRVLAVMGMIAIAFLSFMIYTSNPFDLLPQAPAEGRDLNPLLQDPGLIFHPPMLYMGYVGFSVAFAFAMAALMGGRLDAAWARWSRPWTLAAWIFLTGGITLGSWWAYYELGWGGWWFWDPVENASFMPWLVGTALIHSLSVTEKRGEFKNWTVILAIFTFSLSLLGTFLVRSGVLTSVHAFASDPTRGVYLLVLLGLVIGSSLLLFAVRAPNLKGKAQFETLSRETALLVNNALLITAAIAVLLGTLTPLVFDAMAIGKISVGRPYFDVMFPILMAPMIFVMGIGPMARWRKADVPEMRKRLLPALIVALITAAIVPFLFGQWNFGVSFGMLLAGWVIMASLIALGQRIRQKQRLSNLISALRGTPLSFYGMITAHLGVGLFIIGVTLTSSYSTERDVRMRPGERLDLAGFQFVLEGIRQVPGPNYMAARGTVQVYQDGRHLETLEPEKRTYRVSTMPMTEAAIDDGFLRHLYVSLGDPIGDGSWSVRVYHKPFIAWIWWGTLTMALGGLLAAGDRRYRVAARKAVETARRDAATAAA